MLSMDNLFVFHLVFKGFSVPKEQAVRALNVGIYGAIVFRLVFILCLAGLLTLHYVVELTVGLVLIASGVMALSDDDDVEVHNLQTVKVFKWMFGSRLLDTYSEDGAFFATSETG